MSRIIRSSIKILFIAVLLTVGAAAAGDSGGDTLSNRISLGVPNGLGAAGLAGAPATERIKVIDTAGPVTMSKCEPCHRDLNKSVKNNPNLINFNHPVHFKRNIACTACHVVFPHQPGKTIKPTMDLCANCHRQTHSNQGKTAPSECGVCHPPEFKLTPGNHDAASFTGSGHVKKARQDAQPCLVCHTGRSCKSCHDEAGVKTSQQFRRLGVLPIVKGAGEKIVIGAKVEMSACQACHRDLQRWENPKLVNFSHPPHFKRQIACDKCHDSWPHSPESIKRPEMAACGQCHRLDHSSQGKLVAAESADASEYCYLCHPKDMELKPDFHTAEFEGGDHKNWAKADRGLCRLCHVQKFCDSCHQTEIPHGPDWRSEHGRTAVAVQDQGDNLYCFKCHKPEGPQADYQASPSCAKCHEAVVFPHPKPWAPQHGKKAAEIGVGACETCHVKKSFCDKCHGGLELPHDKPNEKGKWLGEHRLFLRDNSVQVCLTCHKQGQCEQCHSVHKVHNRHKIFKVDGVRFF